ncbi:MAG: exodeoxyribonuclease III [Acidithiobacillus sp.]
MVVKIAAWNVNSLKVRLPQVLDWLAAQQPDVLCLQETKLSDAQFPAELLRAAGYHGLFHGQPTYNGVAILSRAVPADPLCGWPDKSDSQARLCAASVGSLRVVNVYVPNGQSVGSDKYAYKLEWLARLRAFLADELLRHPRLVLLGDFNIAPTDRDVYDPAAWGEEVLCSPAERAALAALHELGLHDSFRHLYPEAQAWSWWDYRAAMFRRDLGLRIDLILVSSALLPALAAAGIDREARRAERPSDHAPVWLELGDLP